MPAMLILREIHTILFVINWLKKAAFNYSYCGKELLYIRNIRI